MKRYRPQSGMTLVEILVALAITSFLMIGLFTIVQTTMRASTNQNSLSQLQDNERLAMQRIGDVVQQAGYYTGPLVNSANGVLTLDTTMNFAAGQGVSGTHTATPAAGTSQDTLTVRYYAGTADNLINCDGSSVSGTKLYYNTFSVVGGNLLCQVTTAVGTTYNVAPAVTLVSGVQDMVLSFGTSSTATCTASYSSNANPVDTYYTVSTMPAASWCGVISVEVALVFANPLFNASGPPSQQWPNQVPYMQLTRLINVMNHI
jgi:type IV pilus assembly protein PilW